MPRSVLLTDGKVCLVLLLFERKKKTATTTNDCWEYRKEKRRARKESTL